MYQVVLVPNSPHNDNGRQRKENLELLAKKASIIGHLTWVVEHGIPRKGGERVVANGTIVDVRFVLIRCLIRH